MFYEVILVKDYKKLYAVIGVLILVIGYGYYTENMIVDEAEINFVPAQETDVDSKEEQYIIVDIKGEVHNEGIYKVEFGTRLYELIIKAGGLTQNADIYAINQAILVKDETFIYIPSYEDGFPSLINNEENNDEISSLIDINKATIEELKTLPGIGESTAQAIIEYRNEQQFTVIEDIKNVSGIGDMTFESIKDLITV
jgi:competence protein ComEA